MTRIASLYESMEYGPAPESPDRATEWLDRHARRFGLFIGGAWDTTETQETFATHNPATGAVLASVTQASADDVERAVAAARAALPGWGILGGHGRARHLYAIARRLQRQARLFSVLETLDNGKPVRESRDLDIPLVSRHFYHHAGWAQLMEAELPKQAPLGVIGQIIPWNFPLLMLAWKIAPALAMGNTVVLKPAEYTPLTALLFAELCADAGLPPGVINIITGDGATGAALVAHSGVDKIAFTGSTEVGRTIRVQTAGSGKRLSLELGGKSPFVVYEDADLDSVVEGVVDAIWFNQGQVCCAGSRILVQEGIAGDLERKLRARMERLRIGDPLDKGIDLGAIISPDQLEKIHDLVSAGQAEGAQIWQPSWSTPQEGWFYPPTLCTGVSSSSTIAQVEIFGPVVVMMTFRTPKESIAMANDTRYGLAASLWTEDINVALDIAPQIKAGTIWINCTNLFDAAAEFGGYRESGYGREGGREGLFEYVRPAWEVTATPYAPPERDESSHLLEPPSRFPPIDRTAKLYIGGKQVRPDAEYSLQVKDPEGAVVAEVPRGSRKDLRNAVEAARSAAGDWALRTSHNRGQILYYLAENLAERSGEFAERLENLGAPATEAEAEVEMSLRRLFSYAAWSDKWDGRVHHTPFRNVTLAMPEPIGVLALVCPNNAPLLGFVSTIAPAIAMGNAVVVVPSRTGPVIATDFYQVLDTSDVPPGVVNVVTGLDDELRPVLAAHDNVDGMWYFGTSEGGADVERLSTGNLKRTWVNYGRSHDWFDPEQGEGDNFLRQATQIKNIWIPYGA